MQSQDYKRSKSFKEEEGGRMEGPSNFDINKWNAGELRKFLQKRGVPASGYTKSKLLHMVKKAQQSPGILEEVQQDDREEAGRKRRTIKISGLEEEFPHPETVTGWKTDLSCIPNITNAHCFLYLVMKHSWSENRVKEIEKDRGYQLYLENHIQNVLVKNMLHDTVFIRGTCIRQTKQSENPYSVWLLVSSSGDIYTAGCHCIG